MFQIVSDGVELGHLGGAISTQPTGTVPGPIAGAGLPGLILGRYRLQGHAAVRASVASERAWQVARGQRHQTYPRPALPPDDAGQDRSDIIAR